MGLAQSSWGCASAHGKQTHFSVLWPVPCLQGHLVSQEFTVKGFAISKELCNSVFQQCPPVLGREGLDGAVPIPAGEQGRPWGSQPHGLPAGPTFPGLDPHSLSKGWSDTLDTGPGSGQ